LKLKRIYFYFQFAKTNISPNTTFQIEQEKTALFSVSFPLCLSIFDMANELKLPLFTQLHSDVPSSFVHMEKVFWARQRAWAEKSL